MLAPRAPANNRGDANFTPALTLDTGADDNVSKIPLVPTFSALLRRARFATAGVPVITPGTTSKLRPAGSRP
jgi:hypothetical protein